MLLTAMEISHPEIKWDRVHFPAKPADVRKAPQ